MGKPNIVEYVRSLDADELRELNRRLDRFHHHNKRYTWEGFVELHFDPTTLWGLCNRLLAALGTGAGLVYGLWTTTADWRGVTWLLLVTGFTTLVGLIGGTFATVAIVGGVIVAVFGGIVWLIAALVSLIS